MDEFEIILGRGWLSFYRNTLYCFVKTVIVAIPWKERLEWEDTFKPSLL